MNNSVERAAATSWNSGRRATRPISTISATASKAGAKDQKSPACASGALPNIETTNRIGATSRSWNSRTEKMARPDSVFRRRRSAKTGTVMAVDERASAAPSTTAAGVGSPNQRATP